MRRYLTIHLSLLISFFILMTLVHQWFDLMYLPFWIGGALGFILPDLDYLIYHYFLRTSTTPSVDSVVTDVTNKNVLSNWSMAAESRENKKLIFHTAHFQLIFLLFTFFVLTSSGSLLGRGIVLGFMLHLLVDQFMDYRYRGSIDHWFTKIPYELDARQKRWYMIVMAGLLLLFGFVF